MSRPSLLVTPVLVTHAYERLNPETLHWEPRFGTRVAEFALLDHLAAVEAEAREEERDSKYWDRRKPDFRNFHIQGWWPLPPLAGAPDIVPPAA